MSTTRSLTSQLSYLAGINLTAGLGRRARFGEDPWLDEGDAAVAELASVVDDAVAGCGDVGGTDRLAGICGTRLGSGGAASGDPDLSRLLPLPLTGSRYRVSGSVGGEYCVPTSIVCFDGEWVELVGGEYLRFCDAGKDAGDWAAWRGKAAGDGGLMNVWAELEAE